MLTNETNTATIRFTFPHFLAHYWCVDAAGNQLPYIDTIISSSFQNDQAEKLNALSGKIDFGHHWVLGLTDVSTFKAAEAQSKLAIRFWDSGSGSGQAYFLNYDFKDEKWRTIIRDPRFRKALSHASNRAEVQKLFYFNTGEPTTGTFSPKEIEYSFNDEAKEVYKSWRDSAVKFDPEKAKALLDEMGIKDSNGDGLREFPDGSEMKLLVDYKADNGKDTIRQVELLTSHFKEVGLNAVTNPNTPNAWGDSWYSGERFSDAQWGIGDGPNHLVYPQWLVPIEKERWAPLTGTFYALKGTEKEGTEADVDPWKRTPPRLEPEKGGAIEKLWTIYDQTKVEPDAMKRHKLVWDMIKLHVSDGPFVIGSVANFQRAIPVNVDLKNVPMREELALGGFTDPWIHPTPAVYDPESWFFDNPDQHV